MVRGGYLSCTIVVYLAPLEVLQVELIQAVLHLGQQKIEAAVRTDDGTLRIINYEWKARERTNVPPGDWGSVVFAEAEYQISEDRSGRLNFA